MNTEIEEEDTAEDRYNSHQWKRYCTDSEYAGKEYYFACKICGCEDFGDPCEFPELDYPRCEDFEQ